MTGIKWSSLILASLHSATTSGQSEWGREEGGGREIEGGREGGGEARKEEGGKERSHDSL